MRIILTAAMVLGMAATPALAIQRYDALALPTGFSASRINAGGDIIGGLDLGNGQSVAAIYRAGVVTAIPGAAFGRDINDAGFAIGVTIGGRDQAYTLAPGGGWVELTYPDATDVAVFTINELGAIGGSLRFTDGSGSGFILQDGVFNLLPDEFFDGGVFSLNDDNDATGRFAFGSRYFVLRDGDFIEPIVDGRPFEPGEINNSEQVAGFYRDAQGNSIAAVLEGTQARRIGDFRRSSAFLINDPGQVIGFASQGVFLYYPEEDRAIYVNRLLESVRVQSVIDLADDGRMIAFGDGPGGGIVYYLLTPGGEIGAVPEPASWALMIAGFGMVGAGLRRRRQMSGSNAAATLA